MTHPDAANVDVAGSTALGDPSSPALAPILGPTATIREALRGPAVRPGHLASVKFMITTQFAEIVQLFDSYEEIGGSYFRPLDDGVRAVDLDPLSLKPRISIGKGSISQIRLGATATELEPIMAGRLEHLRFVRGRQKQPSRENQFEARLIRAAQLNGLVLNDFPASLRSFTASGESTHPTAPATNSAICWPWISPPTGL